MIEDKRKIVTQVLGSYYQKGDEHLYHCPFCNHHKKKMSVNFAKGYWKCWTFAIRKRKEHLPNCKKVRQLPTTTKVS